VPQGSHEKESRANRPFGLVLISPGDNYWLHRFDFGWLVEFSSLTGMNN
jgi:hypothetical protein